MDGNRHTPTTGRGDIEPIKMYAALTTHKYRWRGRWRHRATQGGLGHHTPATGGRGERVHRANPSGLRFNPHTKLQVLRGGESHRANQVDALTPTPATGGVGERVIGAQSSVCARHTPATAWRGERRHRSQSSVLRFTTHQLQVRR